MYEKDKNIMCFQKNYSFSKCSYVQKKYSSDNLAGILSVKVGKISAQSPKNRKQ